MIAITLNYRGSKMSWPVEVPLGSISTRLFRRWMLPYENWTVIACEAKNVIGTGSKTRIGVICEQGDILWKKWLHMEAGMIQFYATSKMFNWGAIKRPINGKTSRKLFDGLISPSGDKENSLIESIKSLLQQNRIYETRDRKQNKSMGM